MSKPLPPCTCDKPNPWHDGKGNYTNVCKTCQGQLSPEQQEALKPKPPPPPPPKPTLHFRGVGWPVTTIIPKDPANGIYQDKEHHYIANILAVRVDELTQFCREHPDLELGDLADMIDKGEFK